MATQNKHVLVCLLIIPLAAPSFAADVYVKAKVPGQGVLRGRDRQCFVITPKHVVEDSVTIELVDERGESFQGTTKKYYEPDIAIVRVEGDLKRLCELLSWDRGRWLDETLKKETMGELKSLNEEGKQSNIRIHIDDSNEQFVLVSPAQQDIVLSKGLSGSVLELGGSRAGILLEVDQNGKGRVLRQDHLTNLVAIFFEHVPGPRDMKQIPAGEFSMGSADDASEYPMHRVYLDAFFIDIYEVTNERYRECFKESKCPKPAFWHRERLSGPKQPVVGVSWSDARAFCRWDKKRLPTEAEWEKAARGKDDRTYPWGHEPDRSLANTQEIGPGKTTEVGAYDLGKSHFGIHDMAGNVSEWTSDWWFEEGGYKERIVKFAKAKGPLPEPFDVEELAKAVVVKNPKGPKKGREKITRGGSWDRSLTEARTSARLEGITHFRKRTKYIGIRCARDAQ